MNNIKSGNFNGTGAAVYIGLGFIPDFVKVVAVEDADCGTIVWSINQRAAEQIEGIIYHTAAGILGVPKTVGTGVQPYEGGDTLTATEQTSVAYGEGVYLDEDRKDYKAIDVAAGDEIQTWTLGNAGNKTGNFNCDVVGGYIGEGSRIFIDNAPALGKGRWYTITALTAGQGVSANEVTLSRAAPSGRVLRVGGMYDYAPLAIGKTTRPGFLLNATAIVNVNDEMQYFEAGVYVN